MSSIGLFVSRCVTYERFVSSCSVVWNRRCWMWNFFYLSVHSVVIIQYQSLRAASRGASTYFIWDDRILFLFCRARFFFCIVWCMRRLTIQHALKLNYGINLKKIIQQSPITILRMFLAGEFVPHKIEAVFCWVRFPYTLEAVFCWVWGGFYGFRLWEGKMLWVQVMGVTLV